MNHILKTLRPRLVYTAIVAFCMSLTLVCYAALVVLMVYKIEQKYSVDCLYNFYNDHGSEMGWKYDFHMRNQCEKSETYEEVFKPNVEN